MRVIIAGIALLLCGVAASEPPSFTPGAGTEGRAWLPERPAAVNPMRRYIVGIKDDVAIPTRDGTQLDARLFTPALPPGTPPPPCLLMADGYGRTSQAAAPEDSPLFDLAARGYAVVHLSLRGTGRSQGVKDLNLYSHYGEDGYDVVEWMARQSWCNGRVGMIGMSLLGISQWLTAKEAPPSLKALVPVVACGDCYSQLWYPGGMLPGVGREERSKLAPTEYAAASAHRDFDDFWRARSVLAGDMAAIAARGVAVFIAGGWDDYITPSDIRAYEQFEAPGAVKRLFLGPYAHWWRLDYIGEEQARFLDHWLRGVANGAENDPKVTLYIKGAHAWRTEPDWPLRDAHPVTLLMSASKSGSIASRNDGSLAARAPQSPAVAPSVLPYSPDGGPFLPVISSTDFRLDIDQRPDETKVLTWTTAPLRVATEVTGYPRVMLYAASSSDDGDLVFDLTDVSPDGSSHQVVQGYFNAPRALGPDAPRAPAHPLTPGQVTRYELSLYPTAYVFQPGHRIRLALAGGAKLAPGQEHTQGPGKNPRPFVWRIFSDREHPSSLELPIIGSSWAPLARTAVR